MRWIGGCAGLFLIVSVKKGRELARYLIEVGILRPHGAVSNCQQVNTLKRRPVHSGACRTGKREELHACPREGMRELALRNAFCLQNCLFCAFLQGVLIFWDNCLQDSIK